MKLSLVFALFLTFSLLNESKAKNLNQGKATVTATVFYNPYNADSLSFIKNQGQGNRVWDLMLPQKTDLDINFVPWSNLNPDATSCPDGDNGCLATRLHACAIEEHKDMEDGNHKIFHFIWCTETDPQWKTNPTESVVQCINRIGEWPDEGETIVMCAQNKTQSDVHLASMKKQSDDAQASKVPFVQIDSVHNPNAETDFFIEICNSFTDTKPEDCPTSANNAEVTVGVFYNPYNDDSINFIKSQANGSANGIWDLMLPDAVGLAINLVPWTNANTRAYNCPDNDNECFATRLQACAIHLHKDFDVNNHQIFHFILCTESHPNWKTDPTQAVTQCINQVGEWPDEAEGIEECAKDHADSDYHLSYVKRLATDAKVSKVPFITVNGQQNDQAQSNLLSAVCGSFKNNRPSLCGSGAKEIISNKVFIFTLILIAIFKIKP